MLVWPIIALALAQASATVATPHAKRFEEVSVRHAWNEVPKGWEFHSTPSPDQRFDLRIGLNKANRGDLVKTLYEVSDPKHERYGQHLSKEELEVMTAPHPDSLDSIESWLEYHGVAIKDATARAKNWISINVTVEQAERMLGTTYGIFHHPKSSDYVLRTLGYSLPTELQPHVAVVSPTTYFGTIKSMRSTSHIEEDVTTKVEFDTGDVHISTGSASVPAKCDSTITPDCLIALYNTGDYTPSATDENILGIAGYLDEYANHDDLATFFDKFLPDASGTDFEVVKINGGEDDQSDPGVEANLDIQYTEAISYPTPNIYYSTGGSPPFNPDSETTTNTNEPYLDFLNYILDLDAIPQTISTSYGDDEQTVPEDYANSVCDLMMELGTRGTTLLFSSGDFGVGGGDCATNDGKDETKFQPAFPASCPYVTAVGGTTGVPETAVDFSGGGFSNYFGTPDYQSDVVAAYTDALGDEYEGLYNTSGRAYPDLAAQGTTFQVVIGGKTSSVGGTSASAPTVAGIVALLNDYRLSNGKSSLGFLNPLIYANPDAFNDITSGTNPGCGTDGFEAVAGWDPVTGLGTPDFVKLQDVVLA